MPAYPIPPWLSRPADPAAHYTTGLQIGMRMGQEQAQAEMSQQMMEREMTRDAVDRAVKQQTMQLRTQQAARAFQAQQEYQQMVAAGVDPKEALLQVGPRMGITGPGLAALARPTPQPPPHVLAPGQSLIGPEGKTLASIPANVPKTAQQEVAEIGGRKFIRTTQPSGTVTLTDLTRPQEQAETRELARAQAELRRIDRQIDELKKNDPYATGDLPLTDKMNPAFRAAKQKKLDSLHALEAERDALEKQMQTGEAAAPTVTQTNAAPKRLVYDPTTGGFVGQQTAATATAAPKQPTQDVFRNMPRGIGP